MLRLRGAGCAGSKEGEVQPPAKVPSAPDLVNAVEAPVAVVSPSKTKPERAGAESAPQSFAEKQKQIALAMQQRQANGPSSGMGGIGGMYGGVKPPGGMGGGIATDTGSATCRPRPGSVAKKPLSQKIESPTSAPDAAAHATLSRAPAPKARRPKSTAARPRQGSASSATSNPTSPASTTSRALQDRI